MFFVHNLKFKSSKKRVFILKISACKITQFSNIFKINRLSVFLIGAKAKSFFKNLGLNIQGAISGFDKFTSKDVDVINEMFMSKYLNGSISAVIVAYNRFKNTMLQLPVIEGLLPLSLFSNFQYFISIYIYKLM